MNHHLYICSIFLFISAVAAPFTFAEQRDPTVEMTDHWEIHSKHIQNLLTGDRRDLLDNATYNTIVEEIKNEGGLSEGERKEAFEQLFLLEDQPVNLSHYGLDTQIKSNDAQAKSALKTMAMAAEAYADFNYHKYPVSENDLMDAEPPYLKERICNKTIAGYIFTCAFEQKQYVFTATPVSIGESGTTTLNIATGGVMTP